MTPTTLADLVALYAARGGEHYGEDVTQTDHAVQSAVAAMAQGATQALVAATLLHDIGHLLAAGAASDPAGDDHAATGAAALGTLFGPTVCAPVGLHVAAKRYLCATELGYRAALSRASQVSLRRQGGPFDATAAARFGALPGATDAVALRRYDDGGKRDDASPRAFADFLPLLACLAAA